MAIEATCPHCSLHRQDLPDDVAGQTIRCTVCSELFDVPGPAAAPEILIQHADEVDSNTLRRLEPAVVRLKEIKKRCASLSARNPEFEHIEDVLETVISGLKAGRQANGEPVSYRKLRTALFPVGRLFESVGFMSVGREVAHVERVLGDLEPDPDPGQDDKPEFEAAPDSGDQLDEEEEEARAAAEAAAAAAAKEASRKQTKRAWGLIGGFVALLAAMVGGFLLVESLPEPVPEPEPTVPATVIRVKAVTPGPSPTPDQAMVRYMATREGKQKELTRQVNKAQEAIAAGNLSAAINFLNAAATIEEKHTPLLVVAREIVDKLQTEADIDVAWARWDSAYRRLDQARSICQRFGFDFASVNARIRRYDNTPRFRLISPVDAATLRALAGKMIVVFRDDGSEDEGQVIAVEEGRLLLDSYAKIGRGTQGSKGKLGYIKKIKVSSVIRVKIFE